MHGPQAGNYLFAFQKGQTEVKVAEHQGFDNIFYLHGSYLYSLDFIVVLKNNFASVAAGFSLRPGKFSLYQKTFQNRYIYLIMQQTGQLLEAAGLGPRQMAGAKDSQIEKNRCVHPENLLRLPQVGRGSREPGDSQVPSEAAATKNIVARGGPPPVLVCRQY
jgi:hypothetical protein